MFFLSVTSGRSTVAPRHDAVFVTQVTNLATSIKGVLSFPMTASFLELEEEEELINISGKRAAVGGEIVKLIGFSSSNASLVLTAFLSFASVAVVVASADVAAVVAFADTAAVAVVPLRLIGAMGVVLLGFGKGKRRRLGRK